ncbi:YkgJ family cysteine cluster protein [Streptomyces sp. NBC_00470]|uniref:YkgJ family cysteine cluster protein n=1 Tax=Streptomyces sp. NBC_00470 TaxID=2975753 RepID=UPI0030E55DC9
MSRKKKASNRHSNVPGNPVRRLMHSVYDQIPPFTTCKGLCVDQCTQAVMTSKGERDTILKRHGIELLPAAPEGSEKPCPALVDGQCSVYADRPLICRLYGVAEGLLCPHGCVPDTEKGIPAENALMVLAEFMAATGDDPKMVDAVQAARKNPELRRRVAELFKRGQTGMMTRVLDEMK